jgi:hypothetical protein
MKNLIKIEELFLLIGAIYYFSLTEFEWWWFLVLILLPDISMLGYLVSTKVGAFTYNLFHHRGIAILIWGIGLLIGSTWIELIGVICFAHIAMDRVLGYGLKFSDHFKHTHLGWLNSNNQNIEFEDKPNQF